jgi:hypothetical protein
MRRYVLPGLRILLQIGIPERKRFELRVLEYLNMMACIPKKAGESHVRSTRELHLVFVARSSLRDHWATVLDRCSGVPAVRRD